MRIETVSFKTEFKPYLELVSKSDNITMTVFINECIRKELEQKTAFLADVEARKVTAEEMGIPEIAKIPYEKIEAFMAPEKFEEFQKRFKEHHARIKKELGNSLN